MKFLGKVSLIALAIITSSCTGWVFGEDNGTTYSAVVTFMQQKDGSWFMKQNDSCAFVALNVDKYPFPDGKERRSVLNFTVKEETMNSHKLDGFKYTTAITITGSDSIAVKSPTIYDVEKDEKYGRTGVSLLYNCPEKLFNTCIQDGYLNVCFYAYVGTGGIKHDFHLLRNVDENDPYTVEFRHNDKGDGRMQMGTFIVNFPLKDLPDTGDEPKTLTLRYQDLSTEKMAEIKLNYKSRTDWNI